MRLSEVYTSVQGEGPNTGEPTTFIRFGGCNLRCPGWGIGSLPDGTPVPGCDTTFAVYPQWSSTWSREEVGAVVEQVPRSPRRLCLTGGEPLIQPRLEMQDLVSQLIARAHTVDLFTNGTRELPPWVMQSAVTVVMDYKMPGSGEYGKTLDENLKRLSAKDAVKFVCKDRQDFETAVKHAWQVQATCTAQVWFGVVWASPSVSEGTLAEWVTEEFPTAFLNIQTHKFLWDPDERRR